MGKEGQRKGKVPRTMLSVRKYCVKKVNWQFWTKFHRSKVSPIIFLLGAGNTAQHTEVAEPTKKDKSWNESQMSVITMRPPGIKQTKINKN